MPSRSANKCFTQVWRGAIMLLMLTVIGCGERHPAAARTQQTEKPSVREPPTAAEGDSIRELAVDAVAILQRLPQVAGVTRHGPAGKPTHRIVHLADWHFVERADYAADLRSLSGKPLTEQDIDRAHADLMAEVRQMQHQQLAFLREMIQHHGLKRIHVEALTEQDRLIYDAKVGALRDSAESIQQLRGERARLLPESESDSEIRRLIEDIEQVVREYDQDMLQIGAGGQLLFSRDIEEVLPLEEAAAYAAANPVTEDGTVRLDHEAIEVRQDAQVRLLLQGEPFALIILGGAHDLSDNIERLSGGTAEYIRVELHAWQDIAGDAYESGK